MLSLSCLLLRVSKIECKHVHWKETTTLKAKGDLLMAHSRSASPAANALGLLLDKRKLSRRTLLWNMAGVALAGGSLAPLTTACGLAPGTSPASQPTASQALGTTIFTYRGHSQGVNSVAWSPDGKRITSGADDTTVQVWDAVDGGHAYIYHGHSADVTSAVWSPDGKRIASGSEDNTMQVWDATTGSHVFTYHGHTDAVEAVAWSPDGKRIASGGDDSTIQIWLATTGSTILTYHGHANLVWAVAWSPDGKHIVSGSEDYTAQVWQAT
jgi:WD40 repeat protein